MSTINDRRPRAPREHLARGPLGARVRVLARVAILSSLAALSTGCGGRETAILRRDVRLELSHDPPGSAPARQAVVLALRAVADPPLAPGSAHLWYDAGEGWVRVELRPLAGTDRLEAELPPQPRGRNVRYFFAVRSALGDVVRLPRGETPAPRQAAPGPANSSAVAEEPLAPSAPGREVAGAPTAEVYRLLIRAPIAPWAAWLRGAGAVLALVLVGGGATLAARWKPADPPGRPAGVLLEAVGATLFVGALVGAMAASFQATGNLVREIPPAWWAALAAWLPILLIVRALGQRAPGGAGRARRLALLAVALAVLGAAGVVLGLGRML